MIIGVPGTYTNLKYSPFIDVLSEELGIQTRKVDKIDEDIIVKGSEKAPDEACLPVKVILGEIERLSEECDYICLPRVLKTEYGGSLCPKMAGIADMTDCKSLVFNREITPGNLKRLCRTLKRELKKTGAGRAKVKKAVRTAAEAQQETASGFNELKSPAVYIAGHSYNLRNTYSNMDIREKLEAYGITVTDGSEIPRSGWSSLLYNRAMLKRPYWDCAEEIIGKTLFLIEGRRIDGIIYLSSFNCGIDSIVINQIEDIAGDIPFAVIRMDETRASAGLETRLEAFVDILRRQDK